MRKISVSKKQASLLALATILIATNVTLAAWTLTRDLTITGGVQTTGEITVLNQAGTTVLSNFDFPLFSGTESATHNLYFQIKNTGNTPATLTWQIQTSSITWSIDTEATKDFYRNTEGPATKYTLKINKQSPLTGIWAPNPATEPSVSKQITINPGYHAPLALELWYNGEVKTAGTFSLTVRFTAQNS